mmetsp:Transcript_85069/g.214404  ORF Transcript_85069/g.214404 Transcript_85069/m.214404 type:complete len:231 (-) Transcript_85069:916-1608(-)
MPCCPNASPPTTAVQNCARLRPGTDPRSAREGTWSNPAAQTTSSPGGQFVHRVDKRFHELWALLAVEALAQIGNERRVVLSAIILDWAERVEHLLDLCSHDVHGAAVVRPQETRVEVALQGGHAAAARALCLIAQRCRGLTQISRCVRGDHIVASCLQCRQGVACTTGKDHKGHIGVPPLELRCNFGHCRHGPLFQAFFRDVLPHGLKHLEYLATCPGLRRQVLNNHLGK